MDVDSQIVTLTNGTFVQDLNNGVFMSKKVAYIIYINATLYDASCELKQDL